MATIAIILIIWGICRSRKTKRLTASSRKSITATEYKRIQAEQDRRRREAIRAARELEKEIEKTEKLRQRREQAEADRIFILSQLDRVSELLNTADAELARIEAQIEIDAATRSYDSEMRDSKKREAILKRIMQYENRIHSLESRLAKANYILQEV